MFLLLLEWSYSEFVNTSLISSSSNKSSSSDNLLVSFKISISEKLDKLELDFFILLTLFISLSINSELLPISLLMDSKSSVYFFIKLFN